MNFIPNDSLVAIMKSKLDFDITKNQNWYRIPVDKAPPIVRDYKIKYLAFYHTSIFEKEKYTIQYYAKVKDIQIVNRRLLFPEEPINEKTEKNYYKIIIETLKELPRPIISLRNRMIIFIPTTIYKLLKAPEINYIYNNSPLDNKFWKALVMNKISAERDYYINVNENKYCLDFAVFCEGRNLDIECDGDFYHTKIQDVKKDKKRNNELESKGWAVLRFTSDDINYSFKNSVSLVKETINYYGGIKQNNHKK